MTHLIYDGTFEGLMTAIFDMYDLKLKTVCIRRDDGRSDLFGAHVLSVADAVKAGRVWRGLEQRVSVSTCHNVYACFLSEIPGVENLIAGYVRHVFSSTQNVEKDFGHRETIETTKLARRVFREKHRMEAFVRFQRMEDDLYFSLIEPEFDVLPLICRHFQDRYADQTWMIYDKRRRYGILFNREKQEVSTITIDLSISNRNEMSLLHAEEKEYQELWKSYFDHVNIASRKNLKLHIRHVPTRYWKYLTEKGQSTSRN